MRFRILGSLEAIHEGERVPLSGMKAKALALLLLEPGRWIPVQRFADFLWDDEPPPTAVRQVQNTLAALRRVLAEHGGDPIERSGHGYRLCADDIDLVHFERTVSAAREAMRAGDADTAADQLEHALGQWHGSALADLSGDRLEAATARLERERLAAAEALNEAELTLGRNESVITRARELLDAVPYHQRAAAQYMHALHAQGRGVEALECYAEIRGRLADELGLDPGPELREAQRRVLDTGAEIPATRPEASVTTVPAQLPAAVGDFCARGVDLAELDDLIASRPEALRIAVVSGTAGVGKTSLAVKWAHRVRNRFPGGQLYVNLRGFDPGGAALDPAEALHGFLTALGIGASGVPGDVEARAVLFRSLVADRSVLVVLDNAHDAEQVRPLLPGSRNCTVIVTSRRLMPSLAVSHQARQLRLATFDRSESRELLVRRLGAERADAEPNAVGRILDSCSGLPLALAIVAARAVSESRFPLRLLADRLGEADGALDVLEVGDPVGDVRAVFSWSYDALSADAARLFRLIGLHPGPDFSTAAAASIANMQADRARTLLRELTGAHLLIEHRPGRYAAHDLLAAYARERLDAVEREAERADARRRMLSHYLGSALNASDEFNRHRNRLEMPELEPAAVIERFGRAEAAFDWMRTEMTVLTNIIRHAEQTGFDLFAMGLGWAIADGLQRLGFHNHNVAAQQCVLRVAARAGNRDYEVTAHNYIAALMMNVGRTEEAERHLLDARKLCDSERDLELLARNHDRYSIILNELGRMDEALAECREANRIYIELGDRDGESKTLGAIGWMLTKLGRYEEALDYSLRSLALSESTGSTNIYSSTLHTVGYVHYCQGRYDEAMECFGRVVELSRQIAYASLEGWVTENIGDVHRARGEPDRACDHWRRALAIFEEIQESHADELRAKLAEFEQDAD